MSYISEMKQEINKDIQFCNELLEKDYVEGKEFSNIIGKYKTIYPNFTEGLKSFLSMSGRSPNQIENVRIIKSKLELLLIEIQNPKLYGNHNKVNNTTFNVSNSNNNTNTNQYNLELSIDEIEENVKENTHIGNKEKEELLQELKKIQLLQESKESKAKKWEKAKGMFNFIIDKGADIAIMFIPQILKAIQ